MEKLNWCKVKEYLYNIFYIFKCGVMIWSNIYYLFDDDYNYYVWNPNFY
jgi:hypothetical protein